MPSIAACKRNRRTGRRGFTLVEVIVVLVILAILAAILIPSMVRWIDKADQKKLIAECRTCVTAAQTLVAERYGATHTVTPPAAADVLELSELTGKGTVPRIEVNPSTAQVDHLTYQDNGGGIVTYCRDASCGDYYVFRAIAGIIYNGGDTPADTLVDAITGAQVSSTDQIDSGAQGTRTDAIKAYLLSQGVDLGALNVKAWAIIKESSNQQVYLFTDVDISTKTPGDMVRIIRYNERTGTYTAGYCKVQSKTNSDPAYAGAPPYNALTKQSAENWEEYRTPTVVQDDVSKQSYQTTLDYFNNMPETKP